jgi:metacaspase-1
MFLKLKNFDQSSPCTQIGINYFGQDAELRGCINDANNMQKFLCSEQELYLSFIQAIDLWSEAYYGYKREDVVMLTDDSNNPRMMPTRGNMASCL